MSDWKGFTAESKSFMCYDQLDFLHRVVFWFYFPVAWIQFVFWMTVYKLKG